MSPLFSNSSNWGESGCRPRHGYAPAITSWRKRRFYTTHAKSAISLAARFFFYRLYQLATTKKKKIALTRNSVFFFYIYIFSRARSTLSFSLSPLSKNHAVPPRIYSIVHELYGFFLLYLYIYTCPLGRSPCAFLLCATTTTARRCRRRRLSPRFNRPIVVHPTTVVYTAAPPSTLRAYRCNYTVYIYIPTEPVTSARVIPCVFRTAEQDYGKN